MKALHLISTHAPLAGRDAGDPPPARRHCHFNPRAPCGARLQAAGLVFSPNTISTHAPLAGRDVAIAAKQRKNCTNFNPRAPCGARPLRIGNPCQFVLISTHAPLAGRDGRARWYTIPKSVFQPTRPLRGATYDSSPKMAKRRISTHAPLAGRDCIAMEHRPEGGQISTHAPLAGRDFLLPVVRGWRVYFNPRAPCGARQRSENHFTLSWKFQPTRPLRGATVFAVQ